MINIELSNQDLCIIDNALLNTLKTLRKMKREYSYQLTDKNGKTVDAAIQSDIDYILKLKEYICDKIIEEE